MDSADVRDALASLYEDIPDAVLLYGRDGIAISANDPAYELSGFAVENLRGTHFKQHVAARDRDRVELAFATALAGGTDHFESYIAHRDGSQVPIECNVFPARHNGQIVGVFAQARDLIALRSAEESLNTNQQRFRSLFEYHPDGIVELKADGTISRVNVALESETGFFTEQLLGHDWTMLVAPECRNSAHDALRSAVRGEAIEEDSLLLDRLGNRLDVQLKLVPLHQQSGISGAYAIFKNVTAQKNAERAIATQSEQVRRLYLVAASRGESIDEQIDASLLLGLELFGFDQGYVTRYDGERLHIRNAVGRNQHLSCGATFAFSNSLSRHVAGERTFMAIDDLESDEWKHDPARVTAPWRSYVAMQLVVGDNVYGALAFASTKPRPEALTQQERDLIQLMGLFVAAALERAQANESIEQLAFNDGLTGLPNRVLFLDRINNTLATSKRYQRGFAVMYCDLDKFKGINDNYGHHTGDIVLQEVAKRLRATLRESDTVSRFGGDEFVILQPLVDGSSDAADLARKLLTAMQEPITIAGIRHEVHMSIGIALFPSDSDKVETLMESADRALYQAKREGRNRWRFANQETARAQLKKSRREAAE